MTTPADDLRAMAATLSWTNRVAVSRFVEGLLAGLDRVTAERDDLAGDLEAAIRSRNEWRDNEQTSAREIERLTAERDTARAMAMRTFARYELDQAEIERLRDLAAALEDKYASTSDGRIEAELGRAQAEQEQAKIDAGWPT